MAKIYFDYLLGYSKKYVYLQAWSLGRRLSDFLGEELFLLLLDSRVLIATSVEGKYSDYGFKLHSAARALEGFLLKLIKGKKLKEAPHDSIGEVFGSKSSTLRKKIKNKKLIAKTKATWDFCRNDVMHFTPGNNIELFDSRTKFDEIEEVIKLLFKDFYGKSENDANIQNGFDNYFRESLNSRNESLLGKVIRGTKLFFR